MNKNASSLSMLLIATLSVRLVAFWGGFGSLADDPDAYSRLAVTWADSGVLGIEAPDGSVRPTAYRPPLYPWLLSWFVSAGELPRSSIAVLHLVLGLFAVCLTYSIARVLRCPLPWLPALAAAVDPLLLRASQLVMTETIAAFFVVLAWRLWLAVRPPRRTDASQADKCLDQPVFRSLQRCLQVSIFGLVLGLAILVRPTFAPWAAVCAACLVLFGGGCWRRRGADGLLACLGVLVCVVPWTLRNYAQFGKPIWGTTHGGYTLLLANNPQLYEHFELHGPSRGWDAEAFHAAWAARDVGDIPPTDREFWFVDRRSTLASAPPQSGPASDLELQVDALAYASAWGTIERNPMMFVVGSSYRVGWFWALWPYAPSLSLSAIAIGCWYFVWYAAALRGLGSQLLAPLVVRRFVSTWIPVIALVVLLTVVHAIYWGNMRMRAPLMSVIYLLATIPRRL